ncbi:hypothetical protein IAI18_07240 [Acetobacteraceae bacterium H6797]|nr:hypothetical protein [Acetobacteraceae bacterium H6797]
MTGFLKTIALFILLVALMIPAALWIYQIAQFGDWGWSLDRVDHAHLVSTIAKAVIGAMVVSVLLVGREVLRGALKQPSDA